MATIKADILNILGNESASTYLEEDIEAYSLIEQAIWDAANVLPPSLIVASAGYLGDDPENLPDDADSENDYNPAGKLYEDGAEIDANTLILFIERVDSNNTFEANGNIKTEDYEVRFCKEVSILEKNRSLDPDSIYFATDYTPVYWVEHYVDTSSESPDKRKVFTAPSTEIGALSQFELKNWLGPTASALKIYSYPRQTGIDANTTAIENISTPARSFVIKCCALKILDQKIANQAIVEEDTELYGLIKAQADTLKAELEEELKQLREVYAK
tara:strand:- start:856 stop:1674 length:819 start_codon:yes stop_codon:yes gene_type:complete